MTTRPIDPYAGLKASWAKAKAKAAQRQQTPPRRPAAAEDEDYSHLHGGSLRRWQESRAAGTAPSQPSSPSKLTQTDRATAFAHRMAEVAAQVAGREVRPLVAGPRQGVTAVTGSDLVAAQRRREAERAAAAVRR